MTGIHFATAITEVRMATNISSFRLVLVQRSSRCIAGAYDRICHYKLISNLKGELRVGALLWSSTCGQQYIPYGTGNGRVQQVQHSVKVHRRRGLTAGNCRTSGKGERSANVTLWHWTAFHACHHYHHHVYANCMEKGAFINPQLYRG